MIKYKLSLIVVSLISSQIYAADGAVLGAVEVSESADDGYRAKISEIGKTTTPILEIPQTVNVVTTQQLEDKKPENLMEALQNVSGVSYANSVGGIFDSALKRGFGGNRDGSIMRNGVAAGVTHNFNATAQSVEVLKGPAGLLYGIQDPGGVVNIVTKKPKYEFLNEIYASVGNHHYYNYGLDTTGPIKESGFAYRLIFEQSAKDYWREFGEYKNFIIAPSISYKGDDYRIDIGYTHTKYTDPVDRGMYLSTITGKILPIDRKVRLDEKVNEINGKVDTLDIGFEKNFGENWLLNGKYAYSSSIYDYAQVRIINVNMGQTPLDVGNGKAKYTLQPGEASRRYEYYSNFKHRTHAGSLHLNGFLQTGDIAHNLLIGVDTTQSLRRRPENLQKAPGGINGAQSINIYSPIYGLVNVFQAPIVKNSNQYEKTSTIGGYFQDNINLTDKIILVAGLRYEYFDQIAGKGNPVFKETTNQHGGKFIYNTGLLYLLAPDWSIYTSYAQSFRPQSSIAAEVSSSLPPEEGDSIEIGTKFQNDNITATFAVFDIKKKNVGYSTSINNVKTMLISGKVRSRGVELDANGRVTGGLSMGGSYTYTKTNELKNEYETWRVGKPFEATPKHQASLMANYDFAYFGVKGLRIGTIARYFGSWYVYNVKDGMGYKIPHAITYDAFASYTTKIAGYETSFQFNVKNLTDKLYYVTAASGTQAENVIPIIPGYARQFMLTASVKF